MPHSASRNELGPEREQIIFRFSPDEFRNGTGDEEEAVMDGIRAQLTDVFRGWAGMAVTAQEQRPATEELRKGLRAWFNEHGPEVTWSS